PLATYGDGSCVVPQIEGCTNGSATNYNPSATHDNGTCTYNNTAPISAPSIVYNGAAFTPICGAGVNFFDVPNAYGSMNCGTSISFGDANGITYEVRGLDNDGNPVSP